MAEGRVEKVFVPVRDGARLTTTLYLPASVGTAAWNSRAGALPWGQPTDQRYDDAASLTWEWPAEEMSLLKLCDVFPDGASALLTRGVLNLTYRSSSTAPEPPAPGRTSWT